MATDKALARSVPKPEPSYKQATKQSNRRLSLVSNSSIATEPATATALNGARVTSQPPLPNRPGSSQSCILPNTNASSRGPSIPPVKKTRAPANSRDAPKTARAASRASVASKPRVSASSEARQRQASAQQPTNGPSASADADIDSLTAGMNKVKINLTTKAQRDAKAAASAAVANMPAPNTSAPPPSNTAVTASQAAHGIPEQPQFAQPGTPPRLPLSRTGSYMGELPPPTPEPLTPHPSIADRLQQLQVATSAPLPTSSPPRSLRRSSSVSTTRTFTPTTPPQPQAAAPSSNVFIPYQPEGPTPKAGPRDEKLKWLEPNTATPSISPAKRGDLPVFSSTGIIPFGGKRQASGSETKREDDIWEVPETPGKM